MSAAAPELVFSVPAVDLHQVHHGQQKYLSQGPFNVSIEHNPSGQVMVAEVPGYKWQVATHLACLKSNEFTYIFAVENAPEFFYCILLAADTPKEIQDALDQFLAAVTAFTTSLPQAGPVVPGVPTGIVEAPPVPPTPSSSSKLAAGITSGSSIVAAGLMKAAELAAKGIEKGARMAVDRTKPLDKPSQISPQTTANLERAKMLAATVATFSKTVATGVGSMAATVAGHIVDAVSQSTMAKNVASTHPHGVSTAGEIGQASLLAISHLLDAMEHAARTVVRSSSSATAKVIEHRYGAQAGAASRTGLDAAKHMLEAALAMKQLKAKAILKATAKHTATGLIAGSPSVPAPGSSSSTPAPALQMSAATPGTFQLQEPSVLNGVPVAAPQPIAPAAPTPTAPTAYPTAYAQPGGAYPAYPQPQ